MPAEYRKIKRKCTQDRFISSASIMKQFLDATGIEKDTVSVRRRLINAGLIGRHPKSIVKHYTDEPKFMKT